MGSGNLRGQAQDYLYKAAMQESDLPLPPGVREKHGSWHLVRKHVWTKLCRVTEGRAQLYIRLAEELDGQEDTVWFSIVAYLTNGMKDLAPATQKHYRATGMRMLHHFGHLRIDELEPTHCAQFLKWCRDQDRAVTGNREKAFMSSVFEHAMSEGRATHNPWRGVRRSKERPSRKYVEHEPLVSALDRAPPELYALMGAAYLTGIRQTDLRLAKWDQVKGDVLHVIESKTGKPNEHEITPTVRLLLDKARENTESIAKRYDAAAEMHERLSQYKRAEMRRAKAAEVRSSPFIFLSRRGKPWSESGLGSALQRFDAGFQFRQLRPKAQTDRPDKDVLGHSGQMRERYHKKRKLSAVK
jgi:site-specific recombinase XerD